MKLSKNGIKLLSKWEGCRLMPYDDQTGKTIDYWTDTATIGVGHLIHEDEWRKFESGISQEYADKLLAIDIEPRENTVNHALEVEVNQSQFDALVIFVFNIGSSGFVNSSARKIINDPKHHGTGYDNLETAWKAWNKSKGKVMEGLVNRRLKEWSLYNE